MVCEHILLTRDYNKVASPQKQISTYSYYSFTVTNSSQSRYLFLFLCSIVEFFFCQAQAPAELYFQFCPIPPRKVFSQDFDNMDSP